MATGLLASWQVNGAHGRSLAAQGRCAGGAHQVSGGHLVSECLDNQAREPELGCIRARPSRVLCAGSIDLPSDSAAVVLVEGPW